MASQTDLPGGIITCLFSDIEGSTQMLRELGPDYEKVLHRHHALLRAVWESHGGHEVQTIGDAFFVVFAESRDAVAAAIAAQRALTDDEWPGRVRIGLHTGYARPTNGDYTALVVHRAARVAGAARGGQILLTRETAADVDESLVHRLGRFRVRDFDSPIELYAATGEGVPAAEAQPRVPPADSHNMTRPATSIVGRDDDLARVRGRIAPRTVTTLIGPGGVGKTRLALEVALDVAHEWEHGAWFIDLAPVDDPALIGETIGAAVGAPVVPGDERWPEVLSYLEQREALLVLDNCEHLVQGACRAAAELVESCRRVAVLATSRAPLGLRGEELYRVSPLVTEGAVDLFYDRAADEADREVVAALCEELDGLPLAIELAAARTAALPAPEILRQVRRSPSVVRSRDPTLPGRQRSLERLLDWSLDLLAPAARTALCRLSVFASGFDVHAAERVAADGAVVEGDVAGLLWDLIEASLIRPVESEGATRYRLLTTVRAHARDQADPTDLDTATRRLGSLLLERVGPLHATRHSWVVEMEVELDNVRGCVARVDDPVCAQSLAWCVGRFHDVRDTYRDGISELQRFLRARPEPSPERVALLTLLADLHLRLGECDEADTILTAAEALAATAGNPGWDEAGVARARGDLALRRDDADGAAAAARRGLEWVESLQGRARLYDLLGIATAALGDLASSADAFSEELRAATTAGDEAPLATLHGNLAETYLRLGDDAAAARHQAISLGLARDWGQPVLIAFAMMVAARLAAGRAHAREAVVLEAKADQLLAEADYALYEEDEEIRSRLLTAAALRLGEEDFATAQGKGVALSTDAAADLAERVLAAVGSVGTQTEGAR
jgi:predicted ATPase/class 3 adenylate cyclase